MEIVVFGTGVGIATKRPSTKNRAAPMPIATTWVTGERETVMRRSFRDRTGGEGQRTCMTVTGQVGVGTRRPSTKNRAAPMPIATTWVTGERETVMRRCYRDRTGGEGQRTGSRVTCQDAPVPREKARA